MTVRLLRALASGAAAVLVLGLTAGTASAASAPAARHAGHVSVTASMHGHASSVVHLGARDCAALRSSLAASRPGTAPMRRCEVGVGLAPDFKTRTCAHKGTWTTCYDKGTICFGDAPEWGNPNGSFSCRGEAYVSVDGRWKYKTPHNHKVWLLGQVLCPMAYFEGTVTRNFCGHRNNGHPILTMECLFTWSGHIGPFSGGGNGYIAMYAHYNGKITLFGHWNTQ